MIKIRISVYHHRKGENMLGELVIQYTIIDPLFVVK